MQRENNELTEKYDSNLLKVFYIHGCTGRLYHTDAMPEAVAKRRDTDQRRRER